MTVVRAAMTLGRGFHSRRFCSRSLLVGEILAILPVLSVAEGGAAERAQSKGKNSSWVSLEHFTNEMSYIHMTRTIPWRLGR